MSSRATPCLFCSNCAATPTWDKSSSYPLRQLAELFLTKVGGGYFSFPQEILDKDSISALCYSCHELIKEIIQIQTQIGQLQAAVGSRVLLLRRKVLNLDAKEATNCSKNVKKKVQEVDKLRRKVRNALLGLPGRDDNVVMGREGGQRDDMASCGGGGGDDFVIHPEPDEWSQDAIKIEEEELDQQGQELEEVCEDRISPSSNSPLRRSSRRTANNGNNDENEHEPPASTPKKPLLKPKTTNDDKADDSDSTNADSDPEWEAPIKEQIDKTPRKEVEKGKQTNNRRLCQICGKSISITEYGRHMNAHQGIRRVHKCATCGEQFKHHDALKSHKMKKHGADPYICDQCGAKFTFVRTFDRHKLSHLAVKPFKCDVCGAGFLSNTELTIHTRSHTGERPYVCRHCSKGFSGSSNLALHIKRIHTPGYVAPKPFLCQDCGKVFSHKHHLKEHARTRHTGERPFVCGICDKGFAAKSKLVQHSKNVHGEQSGNNGPESKRDESPESQGEKGGEN